MIQYGQGQQPAHIGGTVDDLIKAAIPAILNDEQAKKALLDYIKALTDKERPKEEWRKVWWQLSDDVRRYNGKDLYTTVDNPPCRLFVEVSYSYRGIGHLTADLVSESFEPNAYWDDGYRGRFQNSFHKEAFDAKNFVDAIEQGQAAWVNVHAKWVAATLPNESTNVPR